MADLNDGESVEMKGSGAKPYVLKNVGGVYSCTCPAWRNQSVAIERRSCKHLRKLRGDTAEEARVGQELPPKPDAGTEGEEGQGGPPLLLAERWDNATDLAGWWMSEKLDGVRAYWDGKTLISRLGNAFHAPDWFLEGLPDTPLDGELWIGRKAFQRTVGIVRRQDKTDLWKQVSYVAFDAPAIDSPFEERLATVRAHVENRNAPYLRAHDHMVCSNIAHLREELARVEALGGEGLMLRQPGSRYEVGRSMTLLKVKNFRDGEARVLEHLKGAGRHKGRLGALLVELADGTEFSVGTGFSDAEREAPPAIGAIISFRYQELSDGGVPRFPSYVGVREDVSLKVTSAAEKTPPAVPKAAVTRSETAQQQPAPSQPGRFAFTEGGSHKFWEITQDGTEVTVRYGRIGSAGQVKVKTFADEASAQRHVADLIEEKVGKGYRKV
jgi:DNA ligase-1